MKRRTYLIALIMLIIFPLTNITIYAESLTPSDTIREERQTQVIADGIVYQASNRLTTEGWVDIHILKVDLENPYISLDILRQVETFGLKDQLSDMANAADHVVGGINGAFFETAYDITDGVGIEYEDGDFTSVDHNYNLNGGGAASLIDGNQMFIDLMGASVVFKNASGGELYVGGINQLTDTSAPMVFNTNAANNTGDIEVLDDTYKIVVSNNVVINQANPGTDVIIPGDGYVVVLPSDVVLNSAGVNHLSSFVTGTQVELLVNTTTSMDQVKMVFSGGGKVLENGQLVDPTNMIVQPYVRHPRSAIGLTADGRYMIAMVVDGRGESIGATHEELANYLLEYHVYNAMHLDGGGSSTLVAAKPGIDENQAYNMPSDGGERRIVNGLGFVYNAPLTSNINIELIPSKDKMLLGETIEFEILAYDSNYNTITIDEQDIFFISQGITGTWDDLRYTPAMAGNGTVTCYYGDYSDRVNLSIYDSFYDIDAEPSVLSLSTDETGSFTVSGTSIGGYRQVIPNKLIQYTVTNTEIGGFVNGEFIPTGKSGYTKVVISSGGRSLTTYVTVGVEENMVADFELPDSFSYQLSMARIPTEIDAESTVDLEAQELTDLAYINTMNSLELNPTFSHTGQSSLVLRYNIDTTDIYENEIFVDFDYMVVDTPINQIDLFVNGIQENYGLSLFVKDYNEDEFELPMTIAENMDSVTWANYEANMVTMAYPIEIEGISLSYFGIEPASGLIYIDSLTSTGFYGSEGFMFDYEPFIEDPLMIIPDSFDEQISLFGATSGRNRLLDEVVLDKVYDEMNVSDSVHFTGGTNIDAQQIQGSYYVWNDAYRIIDYADVRVIELATGQGGLFDTDMSQWEHFEADLASTSQNNVIIIADKDPRKDFIDEREGGLLQEVMEEYVAKTGSKELFYVTANGYDFDVEYENGVRYITVNGLWYHINDNKINLNDTFYIVDFYVSNHIMYYDIRNIYPKIEVE